MKYIIAGISIFIFLQLAYIGNKIYKLVQEPTKNKGCHFYLPLNNLVNVINSKLNWLQRGGIFDDVSCLNKEEITGIIQIKTVEDVQNALQYAKENNKKVSIAGKKHSMGAHTFDKGTIVLDINKFNKITPNLNHNEIAVQSGATWHDIQNAIHPTHAIKSMQSTDIFTVGGSISVNAHGMDQNAGSVGSTIKSITLLNPQGEILTLSPTENSELYRLVIGGYGLFGFILDATIEVVPNEIYTRERDLIKYDQIQEYFKDQKTREEYPLFYAHLSTSKHNFMEEAIVYKYQKNFPEQEKIEIPPLEEISSVKLRRFVFNLAKKYSWGESLKWFAERKIEPMIENCSVSRANAMTEGEACLVSRNEPMHDSVPYLYSNLKNDTDILQEYFVPQQNLTSYIEAVKPILKESDLKILNASIRVVPQESAYLNYAPVDSYALVLYINQTLSLEDNNKMEVLTKKLIDITLNHDGTFFLPYQRYYNAEQAKHAYPNIEEFIAKKKQFDESEIFSSKFYQNLKQLYGI